MTAKINAESLSDIARRRAAGESLSSIGQTYEASGEWVRQVIDKNELPSASVAAEARAKAHQDQLDALRAELTRLRENDPALTFAEAATAAGVPLSRARTAVSSEERRLFGVRRKVDPTYSHEQIFADLKKAAGFTDDGILSRQKYDKIRSQIEGGEDMISGVRVLQIFGSWAAACEKAEVKAGSTNRVNYSRTWTEADLLNWVVRFITEQGQQCTYEQLANWLGEQEGAPSAPTVRIRLGKWSTIREMAIRKISAS